MDMSTEFIYFLTHNILCVLNSIALQRNILTKYTHVFDLDSSFNFSVNKCFCEWLNGQSVNCILPETFFILFFILYRIYGLKEPLLF